jgi:hypothetical protein
MEFPAPVRHSVLLRVADPRSVPFGQHALDTATSQVARFRKERRIHPAGHLIARACCRMNAAFHCEALSGLSTADCADDTDFNAAPLSRERAPLSRERAPLSRERETQRHSAAKPQPKSGGGGRCLPTDEKCQRIFFDGKFCPAMRDWNLSSVGEKKADKTNPDDFRSLEFRSVESRGPSDSRCWTKFGFDWRVPPGSAGVPPADARSADVRLHNPTRRRDAGAPRSRV